LRAPFQQNDLLADVFPQWADQIEVSESSFSELPEFGPTFGWQEANTRVDAVLESRRNSLVIFAHGGAFQKRVDSLPPPGSILARGDSLPQTPVHV
jgi:hypothetical protein